MASSRFLGACALMSGAAMAASALPPLPDPRPDAAAPTAAPTATSTTAATATPTTAAAMTPSRDTGGATAWTFARADGTVHQAMQRWAREAGWQLVWEVDRDFPIDADVTLRGDFLGALTQAMAVLRDTDFPLQARVQAETRVVRVVRYLPEGARQ